MSVVFVVALLLPLIKSVSALDGFIYYENHDVIDPVSICDTVNKQNKIIKKPWGDIT